MKKIFLALFVLFFSVTLSAKLTNPKNNLSTEYTIQNGDTLYTIARKHHTTVAEVLKANGLNIHSIIKVGQTLNVPLNTYTPPKMASVTPASAPAPSARKGVVDYTVRSGDTLFTIARAHHTSIVDLLQANEMERGAVLKVGQHLRVPTNTYFPEKTKRAATAQTQTADKPAPASSGTQPKGTYVVQPGDTLFSVARKNRIVISRLMKLNGIGLGDALRVGQVLKVSRQSTFVAESTQTKTSAATPPKTKTARKPALPVGAMPSYTVKKGDTLWQIAREHHLTLAEIRKLNKMSKKDQIHTGMILAVGKAVQPKAKRYKVKKGDTLWLIAKKHHMNIEELRRINHLRRKDRIHTGMILALSKDAVMPSRHPATKTVIAQLKKKGAKRSEIEAVLARVKKSKKAHPDISAILAQVKREKKKKQIETPLRISKKKKSKRTKRLGSAMALLDGRSGGSHRSSGSSSKTIRIAKRYLGRRYVWGAVGPSTFDCSGFTQYVMRKSKGVRLPRVSRKQAYYGKYVSRRHLRPGDLIFFDTSRRRRGYVNHVGIYIGNNKFIHASSGKHRVVITSLNRPFYSSRFKWGRRVN